MDAGNWQQRYPDLVLATFAATGDWGLAERNATDAVERAVARAGDFAVGISPVDLSLLPLWRVRAARLFRPSVSPPQVVQDHEDIVVAHYGDGRSVAEIAAAVGAAVEEVDKRLAAARSEVAVPNESQVIASVRQRRVRRKMFVGAGAAALVVGVVVPLLREPAPPDPPVDARPSAVSEVEPFLQDVDFADPEHGYALRSCPVHFTVPVPDADGSFWLEGESGGVDAPGCTSDLLVTEDGVTWESRTVPRGEGPASVRQPDALRVLGPNEVVVDRFTGVDTIERSHSRDGGRTWRQVVVPAVVTKRVRAAPAGGLLTLACERADSGGTCAKPAVGVVLPGSGETALLASQPSLAGLNVDNSPEIAGGRWWVVGHDPVTGRWALAITADGGRTWRTTQLDLPKTDDGVWAVTGRDELLYATVQGGQPGDNYLAAVFRSDDGGRTWRKAWSADAQPPLPVEFDTPMVLPDGSLVVEGIRSGPGTLSIEPIAFVSEDGGSTFSETAPSGDAASIQWTRGGYLATSVKGEAAYQISRDGIDWRMLALR